MGLVASQARLLLLFGRKSDIENRCQLISNKRMRLSFETGEIARTYVDALSNTTSTGLAAPALQVAPSPTYSALPTYTQTTTQVTTQAPTYTGLSSSNSITIAELAESNLKPYFRANDKPVALMSPTQMYQLLLNGEIYLKEINPTTGTTPTTNISIPQQTAVPTPAPAPAIVPIDLWQAPPEAPAALGDSNRLYTEDDAQATARYEAQTAILQAEDKRLELELKNLETQHKAISTEVDAVNKVIDKNIEKSFKTLG